MNHKTGTVSTFSECSTPEVRIWPRHIHRRFGNNTWGAILRRNGFADDARFLQEWERRRWCSAAFSTRGRKTRRAEDFFMIVLSFSVILAKLRTVSQSTVTERVSHVQGHEGLCPKREPDCFGA